MMVGFQQPNKCECLSFFFFLIIFFIFMIDDISICKFNIVKFVIFLVFLVSLNFTIKMLQTDIVLATNKSIQTFI